MGKRSVARCPNGVQIFVQWNLSACGSRGNETHSPTSSCVIPARHQFVISSCVYVGPIKFESARPGCVFTAHCWILFGFHVDDGCRIEAADPE